jgi:uncharacterized membrane protein
MNWFILALISSMTLSLREFAVKRSPKAVSSAFMSWGINMFMFFIFLCMSLVYRNACMITPSYVKILIIAAIMDAMATLLYLSAIKHGSLSKTIPMLCFIPVVQLFVTPVLVHENLSLTGVLGVLIVVFGSYILNMESWDGLFSPIRSVFRDKSTRMMLAVALIWGVSSSFHKMGVKQTNALFWGVTEIGLISMILFPFAWWTDGKNFNVLNIRKTLWPAVFSSMTVLTYYAAINIGPVAYVSSVRRLGVLISMVLGIIILKEKAQNLSFVGGIIMIVGACVISLFG